MKGSRIDETKLLLNADEDYDDFDGPYTGSNKKLFQTVVHEPVSFTFENITYSMTQKRKSKQQGDEEFNGYTSFSSISVPSNQKIILNDISAYAVPGQILAIMGPSGSGKTTLLDVLSGRANRGTLHPNSKISLNGKPRDLKKYGKIAGYVMQDDALIGTLTVREVLVTTALLRLPASMPRSQKYERANEVIIELGLSKVADNLIGSQFKRGISGGERKRVSIGVELITTPSLLFVDEPTSGLDGSSAYTVVQTLHQLAQKNRTVICSIHQPRSSVYKLLDSLLLLSQGQTIYFGKATEAIGYFSAIGYECPTYTNTADFLLDMVNPEHDTTEIEDRPPVHELAEKFKTSSNYATMHNGLKEVITSSSVNNHLGNRRDKKNDSVSAFYQFWVLLYRSFLNNWRNPAIFWVRLIQAISMALLVGSIFFDLRASEESSGIQKRGSALFFICIYQTLSSMPALALLIEERGRFNRERTSGFYSTTAYFFATSVAQIPVIIVTSITFGTISYWLLGLQASAYHFLIFMEIIILLSFVADSLCLFASSLADEFSIANSYASLLLAFFLLFGGFFIKKNDTPSYWQWASYLSFFKYSFEAVLQNEFKGLHFTCSPSEMNPLTGKCFLPDGEAVLDNVYDMNKSLSIQEDALVLCLIFTVFRTIVLIALKFMNKEKR